MYHLFLDGFWVSLCGSECPGIKALFQNEIFLRNNFHVPSNTALKKRSESIDAIKKYQQFSRMQSRVAGHFPAFLSAKAKVKRSPRPAGGGCAI
jgi:hypothetical protein